MYPHTIRDAAFELGLNKLDVVSPLEFRDPALVFFKKNLKFSFI